MLLVKFRVLCNKILAFFLCISLSIAQQTLFCLKWVQLFLYCSKFLQRGLVVWLKLTFFYLCAKEKPNWKVQSLDFPNSDNYFRKNPKVDYIWQKWYHRLLSLDGQTRSTSSCCSLVIIILLFTIRQTPPKMVTHCSSVMHFLWLSISCVPP